MKILVVTDSFPAVSQTFVILHCVSLIARGHDVRILAAPGKQPDLCSQLVRQHRLQDRLIELSPLTGSRATRAMNAVRRLPFRYRTVRLVGNVVYDYLRGRTLGNGLAAFGHAAALGSLPQFDLVHAHFGWSAVPIAQLQDAGFVLAPTVVTFHGTDLNRKQRVNNRQLYARVFRTVEHMTVGSRFMAEQLLECGIAPDKFDIIPMGIDLSLFNPVARTCREATQVRLVTVGRLIECKGITFAIRAVAQLHHKWPGLTLDVIGDGPLLDNLVKLSKRLGIAHVIRFHRSLAHNSVLEILQNSDIYLHPGIVADDGTCEGQGVAILEAEAMGLPIIASRVGGIPDMVEEGQSAFLIQQKDADELAHCIELLMTDPQLRSRMGESGRQFVIQNCDQEVLTDKWISLYDRLLASDNRS